MMGLHVIVLSSSDIATDLLERRGVIYGDRVCRFLSVPFTSSVLTYRQPRLPMVNELYVLARSPVATPASNGSL